MFGRKGIADFIEPLRDPDRGVESLLARGGKINVAMQAAICLFTNALRETGRDPGELALPGPVRPNVATLIANCVTYEGDRGLEYAALGISSDFEEFSYQPHCFLFLIANAVGTAETLPDPVMRAQIAAAQCPEPLFHAHVLRRWIHHVVPVGNALTAGDGTAMQQAMLAFMADLAVIQASAPGWMRDAVDLDELAEEWSSGYPATIEQPLAPEVKRINGLPMPDFVAELIEDFLAEQQMGRAACG